MLVKIYMSLIVVKSKEILESVVAMMTLIVEPHGFKWEQRHGSFVKPLGR